jgi:alkylation response protein AidB-like acyl-CoA dehydrogenase
VTPLPPLDGVALHAVALEAVEVPTERRIGPEGGAWQLIADALADERHVQFPPGRLRRDLEDVAAWLAARGRARAPEGARASGRRSAAVPRR